MGDWNATCSFSHFPILPGELVWAVPTSLNPFWEERGRPSCHPTDRYQPILPPACGLYDGLGAIETSPGFPMAPDVWMDAVRHHFSSGVLGGREGYMAAPRSVTEFLRAATYGEVVSLHRGQKCAVSCVFVKHGLPEQLVVPSNLREDVSKLFSTVAPYYTHEERPDAGVFAEMDERKDALVMYLAGGGILNPCLRKSVQYYAKRDVKEGCLGFGALAVFTEVLSQLRKSWEPFSGAGSCDDVTPAMVSLMQGMLTSYAKAELYEGDG